MGGYGASRSRAWASRGAASEGEGLVAASFCSSIAFTERALNSSSLLSFVGASGIPFVRLFAQAGHVQVKK